MPQLGTASLAEDYLFAAALLMALAAATNTGFFNKSAPMVGEAKAAWRHEFQDGTTTVAEVSPASQLLYSAAAMHAAGQPSQAGRLRGPRHAPAGTPARVTCLFASPPPPLCRPGGTSSCWTAWQTRW